ncbi:MAG: hypothetical protein J5486_07190 [Bacteroidaceae bacterium]|nr:hypothetical protein [Bacteroidaceae bacterium]
MIRYTLLTLLFLLLPCLSFAQEEAAAEAPQHMLFEGLEMKGDIYDFADSLRHRGYSLEKRMGNQQYFLFKGLVAGRSCYFQVSYTKKSRTVWRIVAQVSHAEIVSFVDSVSVRYGEVFDNNERGYQWMSPAGSAMFMTPEQGDPSLIIVDADGYLRYKDEDVMSQRQR